MFPGSLYRCVPFPSATRPHPWLVFHRRSRLRIFYTGKQRNRVASESKRVVPVTGEFHTHANHVIRGDNFRLGVPFGLPGQLSR